MHENEISGIVLQICYEIHSTLGPVLLESVYEEIICFELTARGIPYERQKALPVFWKGMKMDIGFRPDIVVAQKVVVEIKSVETIARSHPKITLTYIRLSNLKLGLLINFGAPILKEGITRLVNNFSEIQKGKTLTAPLRLCARYINCDFEAWLEKAR